MNVDNLCKIWNLKRFNYENDICALLKNAKMLADQLNNSNDNSKSQTQEQLKLHELMVHLTEELQRLRDEASAKKRLLEWQNSLDRMRAKIRKISQTLGEVGLLDKLAIEKMCDTEEYTQSHYELISQELQRCETLRHENLSILIDHVWSQIKIGFKMTLQNPSIKQGTQECPSVDLLELLEQKVIDLKCFYQSNSDIFELYEKRVELWIRMRELDDLAREPTRYRNRGGQLLREEKERKFIQNKLPEIEAKLGELVQHYEQQSGQHFMVFDEEIMHKIAADWEEFRLSKSNETQRRKQTVFQYPAPRLVKGSTTSSLISLRKSQPTSKSGNLSSRGTSRS